jgi:hypothetical protein
MLGNLDDSLNPHIKLEFFKVVIRSVFASNTGEIRKEIRNEIVEKEESLNQMEELKCKVLEKMNKQKVQLTTPEKLDSINLAIKSLKNDITALKEKTDQKVSFVTKARWYEQGEKSNKFFLNMNKMSSTQKLISEIKDESKIFRGQSEVTKGITEFYKNLYSKTKSLNTVKDDSFYNECPKLSSQNKGKMEKDLTMEDLYKSLISCKDSSPGPDGIPYLVYKKFWKIAGPIIFNSWKYSIETGTLPASHLESVIVLLPKEGKNCKEIKNWRPITLSNCDLKIITKALSNRMATVLEQIIDKSQTAYVPGRSVADNLRMNFYYKNYCVNNKVSSALISLDAKKAFDSVDHEYILDTLTAYGFGPKFKQTFKTLYNRITSRILINGYLSDSINIERGVKQGDALSCAIFIICIDPLLRNINSNKKIEQIDIIRGGKVQRLRYKGAAYADDISVICKNNATSVQQIFMEYERLTEKSGLELNADKTEILILDSDKVEKIKVRYMGERFNILTVNSIKICGLYFNTSLEQEYKNNVISKIEKLKNQLKKWSHYHLTLEGKNLIVKTFGLSQLIYNMQTYKFKEEELKQTEKIIFNFLWSTSENPIGIDRIKRAIMKNEYIEGGMSVTDVECLNRALKLRQFIRANNSEHPISKVQTILNGRHKLVKQEYCNPTEEESICFSAQLTINSLTDYNRTKVYTEESDDISILNEVASINIRDYLIRKNKLFHVCILKSLTDAGIDTLGELMRDFEAETDVNTNKKMKIIISAFPNNLIELASKNNDNTKYYEDLKYLNISQQLRKEISKITTKEFQNILKIALGKTEKMDFNKKLSVQNFDCSTIVSFRRQCKNAKFRSLFFRLIHNDFFTRERMKRRKMVEDDRCIRCGQIETSKHLLIDCIHARKIWSFFNILMTKSNSTQDIVGEYSDIFKTGQSASITTIKIKLIQVLIQIERPRNWRFNNFKEIIDEIIRIEKYNAVINKNVKKFDSKWNTMINLLKKLDNE